MTKFCCSVIGPLVYRAQGYKRLPDEKIMNSKFFIPKPKPESCKCYCLVAKNIALNMYSDLEQILELGSLVIIKKVVSSSLIVEVKFIDYKEDKPEVSIFNCSSDLDSFILVKRKVWNLLAAVSFPLERIRIAKDVNLCRKLCDIKVGDIINIAPDFVGIVKFIGAVKQLGLGTYFGVEVIDHELRNQNNIDNEIISLFADEKSVKYISADQIIFSTSSSPNFQKRLFQLFTDSGINALHDDFNSYNDSKVMDERIIINKDLRSPKNRELKGGSKIVWISETGVQRGTICWTYPITTNAHVHLGESKCKITDCKRSDSVTLPVSELKVQDENLKYFEEPSEKNNSHKKKSSFSSKELIVEDLFPDQHSEYRLNKNSPTRNYFKDIARRNKQESKEDCLASTTCNCDVSRLTYDNNENSDELGIGSVIEVSINGEAHYGVIKWIGSVIYGNSPTGPLVAGIELEEEHQVCSDGILNDRKYFDCAPHRGFFTLLSKCKKDSRFQDSSNMSKESKDAVDFGCAVISGIIEPINQIGNSNSIYGKYKGIQGHNNSCYLDATLFSMFAFTSVFDNLLLRPANKTDVDHYEEVQRVLREEIVNPLRKNQFVRADRVMKLRTLLDTLTSVTGLTCEEKDPEEFLTSLVAQVLKAEPFLKLSSGHEAYYYQLFVEKDERLVLPTVQQLFEQSLITSDIKLKEVPSCLIIQMPRFGKSYKMYPRILPSQLLDVTDVIENSPRQCSVCGELAEYECKECFKPYYMELEYFSYCYRCAHTAHNHEDRLNHKYSRLAIPPEFEMYKNNSSIPRQYMELFAVLCIETSHYVAFVKCGMDPDTPWCFFDSMADREGGLNGYNIPEIVLCADLPLWLSESGAQSFREVKDDRHLPMYAKRLLCDAYMCMYQSTDVMMYR